MAPPQASGNVQSSMLTLNSQTMVCDAVNNYLCSEMEIAPGEIQGSQDIQELYRFASSISTRPLTKAAWFWSKECDGNNI